MAVANTKKALHPTVVNLSIEFSLNLESPKKLPEDRFRAASIGICQLAADALNMPRSQQRSYQKGRLSIIHSNAIALNVNSYECSM